MRLVEISVVVFAAHLVGVTVSESKCDSILIVYADAMAASLITLQSLEMIAGRDPKILQCGCGVDGVQLSADYSPDSFIE